MSLRGAEQRSNLLKTSVMTQEIASLPVCVPIDRDRQALAMTDNSDFL